MNSCMVGRATREEQDAARTEWFETRGQRQREREELERRRIEQEKFHREWWGGLREGERTKDGAGQGQGVEEQR